MGHRQVIPADVLLGVTGGIAAYRAAELCRLFVKDGLASPGRDDACRRAVRRRHHIRGTLPHARADRCTGGGAPVYPHLDAARAARVMVVAPCSANTLAKLAHGLADNVLTESALALAGRLVIAPAMNVRMWEHPATQAAVELLRARGAVIVGPEHGELAEGETGAGRLAAPADIHAAVVELLRPAGPLAGRRVLVTAGGTREPLDPVRFLGNRSSGRMGVALADAARLRGAEVTTLLCNAAVRPAAAPSSRRRPPPTWSARRSLAPPRRHRADGRRRRRLPPRPRR